MLLSFCTITIIGQKINNLGLSFWFYIYSIMSAIMSKINSTYEDYKRKSSINVRFTPTHRMTQTGNLVPFMPQLSMYTELGRIFCWFLFKGAVQTRLGGGSGHGGYLELAVQYLSPFLPLYWLPIIYSNQKSSAVILLGHLSDKRNWKGTTPWITETSLRKLTWSRRVVSVSLKTSWIFHACSAHFSGPALGF